MIIVTGGSGFIGTHLINRLASFGKEILSVNGDTGTGFDNATYKISKFDFKNLLRSETIEYFLDTLKVKLDIKNDLSSITSFVHLGACSDTLCEDWNYLGTNNYEYSTLVFDFCRKFSIPLVYASSAATYGKCEMWESSKEDRSLFTLYPMNKYGWSKLLFDQYVSSVSKYDRLNFSCKGLRFFNVYGVHEAHKTRMASMPWKFLTQGKEKKSIKIYDVLAYRDFVYVEDVVDIIIHMTNSPFAPNGIYNVGSGRPEKVDDVAKIASSMTGAEIEVIPAPEELLKQYQYFTQADMSKIRNEGGYSKPLTSIREGIEEMFKQLMFK